MSHADQDIPAAKAQLRREALARRRAMTPKEVDEKSRAIVERLQALPEFQAPGPVLTYVDSKDNEVQTRPLIAQLLQEGREVVVPLARPGGQLDWSCLRSLDHLTPTRLGILEPDPDHQNIIGLPGAGVCLVPLLAFDGDLYRLGYGGGYYDRFLRGWAGSAIGLAYTNQRAHALPREPHDQPMDCVLTDEATLVSA